MEVTVTNRDACALMHEMQFDFVHVDPFGSPALHLEPAFRNCHASGI